MALIEVEHLSKVFNGFKAVSDVTFTVASGEIIGLLGPNGAGKTTTIHMMLGLVTPTEGEVRIFGIPLDSQPQALLQRINFSAPYVAFPNRLTVGENLAIFARLYNVRNRAAKIDQLLRLFAIEHLKSQRVAKLSSGENTRVGLCKALINDPELLLLDEPTAYLDPPTAELIKTVLRDLRRQRGITILYTSHNMSEVEQLCDRILFMRRGQLIASGTPIEVTRCILQDQREEPALAEVFMRLARGSSNEAA
jgi:ABC-2 type transport system ATP-binding protein